MLLYSNPMRIPLGIILIGMPLLEIYLFIVIGGEIGALSVIALIFISALIGIAVLQNHGFTIMRQFRKTLAQGDPLELALAESFLLLVAGVLLLAPGFFTDTIGLLCLLPFSRRLFIIRYLLPYLNVRRRARGSTRTSGRIIDMGKDQDDWK